MNIIDIITLVCFAVSIILGFKDGVIRQLGTLAGIIIAIIMAKTFGPSAASFFGIEGDSAAIWGYIIVLIACLLGVTFLAGILRKIVSVVGLGIIDRIAGGVLGFIKCALILSIIFSIFGWVNVVFEIVDQKTINSSKLYAPVVSTSKYIMPAITWVENQLPIDEIKAGMETEQKEEQK